MQKKQALNLVYKLGKLFNMSGLEKAETIVDITVNGGLGQVRPLRLGIE